jgi:hypothetical protein
MLQGLRGEVEHLVSRNLTVCLECLASIQCKLKSVAIENVG